MDIRPITRGLAFYTIIAGAITVGCVYFLTYSGLYTVVAAGVGLLLVILGGAASITTGPTFVEGADEAAISGTMTEENQFHPSPADFDTRTVLLFYGLGLVLWSVLVLTFFRSGLQ